MEISIPHSLTEIEDHTFYGCISLGDGGTVDLSNTNLQYIGEKAFVDCKSIRHIALPASLTSLGNYAFESCRVSLVVFFYDNHCTLNLDEFYFPTKAILVENRAGLGDEETSVQKYADAFHLEYTTLTPPTTTTTTVMTTTPPATTIVTTDTTAADHGIRHKRFGDHDHAAVYYRDGDYTGDHDADCYGRDDSLF